MSNRFIQLHVLTAYPPSNLNRDDLGRPKSAIVGDVTRLRVSSQSLKRAWRTSEYFQQALGGALGTRTKEMGVQIHGRLIEGGVPEKLAKTNAQAIAGIFGKLKGTSKDDPTADLEIEQLAHFAPEERQAIDELVTSLIASKEAVTEDQLNLLRHSAEAVDIALFGRMLAKNPAFNIEAAAQVAHAFTVNKATIEDDYFTAVDDLNQGDEDRGAAHIGETGYGSGVYYLYVCINREQLDENLGGEADPARAQQLRNQALDALIEAICKVSPTGKQNSFASRAWASYVMAEKGSQQPRSLAVSFLKPVSGAGGHEDLMRESIQRLHARRAGMESMYGSDYADLRLALDGSYQDAVNEPLSQKIVPLTELKAFVQAD